MRRLLGLQLDAPGDHLRDRPRVLGGGEQQLAELADGEVVELLLVLEQRLGLVDHGGRADQRGQPLVGAGPLRDVLRRDVGGGRPVGERRAGRHRREQARSTSPGRRPPPSGPGRAWPARLPGLAPVLPGVRRAARRPRRPPTGRQPGRRGGESKDACARTYLNRHGWATGLHPTGRRARARGNRTSSHESLSRRSRRRRPGRGLASSAACSRALGSAARSTSDCDDGLICSAGGRDQLAGGTCMSRPRSRGTHASTGGTAAAAAGGAGGGGGDTGGAGGGRAERRRQRRSGRRRR